MADKNDIARWASALTLGQSQPIADDFDTRPFFTQDSLRIHFAATFNGPTAIQIHRLTQFNWVCCLEPENLNGIEKGAALLALVMHHLTDQLQGAKPTPTAASSTALPLVGGRGGRQ